MLARREEPPPKDWEDEYRRLKENHLELQMISNVGSNRCTVYVICYLFV